MRKTRLMLVVTMGTALTALAACGAASTATPPTTERTIAVTLSDKSDDMRFAPSAISVNPGETVDFLLTNPGSTAHEFFVGDTAAQQAHEGEMMSGGMGMEQSSQGMSVAPGRTEHFRYRFSTTTTGTLLYGCHYPGHYAAGMRGMINVG